MHLSLLRRNALLPAVLAFACAFLVSARAETIGIETFDYPNGAIAVHGGGTFWDYRNVAPAGHTSGGSDWNNVFGAAPQVNSGRLVTANGGAKREYEGPGQGPGTDEGNGAFHDGSVHKTVYYRVTLTTGATLPSFFGLSSYDFGAEHLFIGRRSGQAHFGVEITGGSGANSAITVQPNTTYTLVAKIDYAPATNRVSLFVNPDLLAAEPAPQVGLNFATQWSTAVRLASGTGDAITWDDLVVATTWADLTTIVVTTTTDHDDGSLNPALGGGISLREAVRHAPHGTRVTFAADLSGKTITLTLGELVPPAGSALHIDGSSLPLGITLDGNGASRLFRLDSGRSLTLRSLNLTGGDAGGGSGGAVANVGGTLVVRDCTFADNRALHGGALHTEKIGAVGATQVFSSTFTRNVATGGTGGAIRNRNGAVNVFNSTIVGNTAPAGSGGGIATEEAPPTFTSVATSIVAGNTGDDVIFGVAANAVTSFGSNLIGTGNASSRFTQTGDQPGVTNPQLSPLGYFGGPTMTMHPLVGSPAIDTGGTTSPGSTDQRGAPRLVDGDASNTAQLDIGAVEAWPRARSTIFPEHPVTTATDEDDGSIVASFGTGTGTSLREAVKYAANFHPNGNVITFAPELAGQTIILGGSDLPLNHNLFIDASNLTSPVTISGDHASRVLHIAAGATVAMHSVQIVDGQAPNAADVFGGTADPGGHGGGVLNAGTLSLFACTVSGNTAGRGGDSSNTAGDGGDGGGIFSSGALLVSASTFTGNTAGDGGGSAPDSTTSGDGGSGGAIASSGTLRLSSSTFTENSAGNGPAAALEGGDGGNGGGVFSSGPLAVVACTLSGNAVGRSGTGGAGDIGGPGTPGSGGGIHQAGGAAPLLITRSIAAGNMPDNIQGAFTGSANLTSGDPRLLPLGSYGGPTQTMPPLAGSPAIDAGGTTSGFATDQRGFPRVVDGNNSGSAQLDLGAVEAAVRFVTTAEDSGEGSLREAIAQAAAAPGWETVAFSSALDGGTISLTTIDPSSANTGLVITDTDGVAIDATSLSAGLTLTKPAGDYRLLEVFVGGRLSLHQLTLTGGNVPTDVGGAIFNQGTLSVSDCTLTGNQADFGGAIFSSPASSSEFTEIRHCTITGNTATSGTGGGIRNQSGRMVVSSSTISGNHAPAAAGGGIAGYGNGGASETIVTSSIISGNAGGDVVFTDNVANTFISDGHNLIGTGNATDAFTAAVGDIVGIADPLLLPLGSYSGPTPTMPPLPSSPAIDTGSAPGVSYDQRGFARSVDGNNSGGAQPDIGAVEAAYRFVTTVANADTGSLREALEAGQDGELITFSSLFDSPQTISLLAPLPDITKSLNLLGKGAHLLTVQRDPNAATDFRIFTIPQDVVGGVSISGMTLAGGRATGAGEGAQGGGIHARSRLTLTDVHLIGNQASSPGVGAGGAVEMIDADGVFTRCTFSDNQAVDGGAIRFVGGGNTWRLLQSTLSGNRASGFGGAVEVSGGSGTVEVVNSTIVNNSATVGGGLDIFADGGVVAMTLRNTIVAGNTPTNLAGGQQNGGTGIFQTLGFNLSDDFNGAFAPAGSDLTRPAPLLAPLAHHGGPTPTHALLPGSPAINAGHSSGALIDQRGFPRTFGGTADIGAVEYQGTTDVRRFWLTDWDADGSAFGLEHALGTDPLRSDRSHPRNPALPTFNPSGQATLAFGRNAAAAPGTQWRLQRSTDLVGWTEIYRFDGTAQVFDPAKFSATLGVSAITVIDRTPPSPRAFYRVQSVSP